MRQKNRKQNNSLQLSRKLTAFTALSAVLFFAFRFIKNRNQKRIHTAILLGCKTRKNGTMSTSQIKRCKAAIKAYEKGLYDQLVITGGATTNAQSEAQVMKTYLEANAPEPIPILLEEEARNTFENFQNVRNLIDDDEVLIITSSNHAFRSRQIAKQFFSKAANFSAPEYRPKHLAREMASLFLYYLIEAKKRFPKPASDL